MQGLDSRDTDALLDLLVVEENRRMQVLLQRIQDHLPEDHDPSVVYQVEIRDGGVTPEQLFVYLSDGDLFYTDQMDLSDFRYSVPGKGYRLHFSINQRSFAQLALENRALVLWVQLFDWVTIPIPVVLRFLGMTERESEVFTLLYREGMTQQQAAHTLGVAKSTVVTHVRNVRQKLAASPYQPLLGRVRRLLGVKKF